jgi:hypothetical protein
MQKTVCFRDGESRSPAGTLLNGRMLDQYRVEHAAHVQGLSGGTIRRDAPSRGHGIFLAQRLR